MPSIRLGIGTGITASRPAPCRGSAPIAEKTVRWIVGNLKDLASTVEDLHVGGSPLSRERGRWAGTIRGPRFLSSGLPPVVAIF
jgi:hypothetical protein